MVEQLLDELVLESQPVDDDIDVAQRKQFQRWQQHVADQIKQLRADGISIRYRDFWMLRKAVRTRQPLSTVKQLHDWLAGEANNFEALRYAIASDQPDEAVIGFLLRDVHEYNKHLLVWAAASAHARTLRALLKYRRSEREGTYKRKVLELISVFIDKSRERETFAALGIEDTIPMLTEDQRVELVRREQLENVVDEMLRADDVDNDLATIAVGRWDLRVSGRRSVDARAHTMRSWLGTDADQQPDAATYVEGIENLLFMRYRDLQFVGAGDLGVVLSGYRVGKLLSKRTALKFVALIDSSGEEDSAVTNELLINTALQFEARTSARWPVFPALIDWTRVRTDMGALLQKIPTSHGEYHPFTRTGGVGIYLLMEMEMADLSLAKLFEKDIPSALPAAEMERWHGIVVSVCVWSQESSEDQGHSV